MNGLPTHWYPEPIRSKYFFLEFVLYHVAYYDGRISIQFVAFEIGLHHYADDPDATPGGDTPTPALTPLVSQETSLSSTNLQFLYQHVAMNRSYIAPLNNDIGKIEKPTTWASQRHQIQCELTRVRLILGHVFLSFSFFFVKTTSSPNRLVPDR